MVPQDLLARKETAVIPVWTACLAWTAKKVNLDATGHPEMKV
jgi:hypothetical protein